MGKNLFEQKRKSYIEKGEVYFWTATINGWKHLLAKDEFKGVIIDSWKYLTDNGKIDVFAFVIMPNHLHAIWRDAAEYILETSIKRRKNDYLNSGDRILVYLEGYVSVVITWLALNEQFERDVLQN